MTETETTHAPGLCIDAGATKTRVVLRDGLELSEAVFNGTNFRNSGRTGIGELARAIGAHFERARAFETSILAGVSGAGDQHACLEIVEVFRECGFAAHQLEVLSDIALSLRALGDTGVVLIGGTGSVCAGMNGDLAERSGGRGYLFDEASGFAIGLAAVKAYFGHHDFGAEASAVFSDLERHFDISSPSELIPIVYQSGGPAVDRIAGAARYVLERAEQKDPVCELIAGRAVEGITRSLSAVLKKLSLTDSSVGLMGSLYQSEVGMRTLIAPANDALEAAGFSLKFSRLGIDTPDPLLLALDNTFRA